MRGGCSLVVLRGPYDNVACSLVCGVGCTRHYIISHLKLEPVFIPGLGVR
jgi:hypothetical protein